MSAPEDDGPTLEDFDVFLPETLGHILEIGMPSRIWGGAFRGDDERGEMEVSSLLSEFIDAAVWGAQNSAWVLEYKRKSDERIDGEIASSFDDGVLR